MSRFWTDEAACQGYDLNLFFSDSLSDQLYAQSICQSCPARQDCEDTGDADDFNWGVRAGYLPGTFIGAPKRAPMNFVTKQKTLVSNGLGKLGKRKAKDDQSHKFGKKCPKGHVYTAENTDRYGQCRECRKLRNKVARGTLGK